MVSARSDSGVDTNPQASPDGGMPAGPGPEFCAKCGTSLAGCDTFCKACGRKIDREPAPPAESVAPPTEAKRFCNTCGNPVHPLAEICPICGVRLPVLPRVDKRCCNICGAEVHPLAEICPKCGVRLANPVTAYPPDVSPKSRLTATLLCSLLGALLFIFGIHRLYLGKTGSGAAMLILAILGWVTFWIYGVGIIFWAIAGIWQIVDFILIVSGSMTDGDGRKVLRWTNP